MLPATELDKMYMQHKLCLLAYLSAPILAEKYALLNMAIEPVTTALALLRACNQ